MSELRQLSRNTREEPRIVIGLAANHLDAAAASQMPSVPNMKRTIERTRMLANGPGRQPASLADLEIPDDLVRMDNGDAFLLYDSGPQAGNERYSLA